MKLRISLVDYLNSAPLGWSFLHGPHKGLFSVVPSSPARCADQLAASEVDVGLIPSIEYQRIPGLQVIPGISIAAVSSVRSVLLVRPKGKPKVRSLALDTSSRTSVVLIQLLLRHRMGITPELVPHSPCLTEMLDRCDAALLIGDAALRLSPMEYDITDLAEEWIAWQGKPFVFAFWACRAGLRETAGLCETFLQAKSWGLEAREDIAADYSTRLDLAKPLLKDYLDHNIDYDFGPPHLEGLTRFYELALASGLTSEMKPLDFLPLGIKAETPAR